MFLVLTRNSRRVDELSFLARRIPTIETTYIEERSEENKNKILSLSRSVSLDCPLLLSLLYIYIYISSRWGLHVPLAISVRFSPETIDFASVQVSIILNRHSLNIVNFEIFLKIPFWGFTRPTPVASKFVKILTVSESDEIR